MKISTISTVGLAGRTPPAGWKHEVSASDNQQTLVFIEADSGEIGVGTSYTSKALVDAALALMSPHLIGQGVEQPARLSEMLHQTLFWQGRGGAVTHAISGVDIALWDLFGKVCGQPVSRLLGGRFRERVQPYASLLFGPVETLAERVDEAVSAGYRALKIGWRPFGRVDSRTDESLIKIVRDAAGPTIDLMVDAGGSEEFWPHRLPWAVRTAKMLEQYDVRWFEEALSPDDIEGFRALRELSPVAITTGEVLTRRQSFRELLEPPAVDIIQPDTTKVGGLSEMVRIAAAAEDNGVLVVPHGWNNAVGLAADLQLVASSLFQGLVEFVTPSAYMDDLLVENFAMDSDGMLAVPNGPGLGITVDPDALHFYQTYTQRS